MSIFDRMGRVISSNLNSLLDKADDPGKNLDLMLSEMKDQIRQAQREVVTSFASEKQLRAKVEELDAQADKWARRAELAIKAQDDDLAREALVQKKRVVGERDKAEALLAEARGRTIRMKQELKRMEAKHQELDARKGTLKAQIEQSRAGGGAEGLGAKGGKNAFEEFRKFEEKLERNENEAQAAREVDDVLATQGGRRSMNADELEAKFSELEDGGTGSSSKKSGGTEIDQELAALKKKIRIG
jgi:phage shock protein A